MFIKKSGITLIEVIIAIVIFGIGILSIMKVLGNNILIIQHTKLKTQATLLAKEGIELIYNVRDSNIDRSFVRNCYKLTSTIQLAIDNTTQNNSYNCSSWDMLQWWKKYAIAYDPTAHYQIQEIDTQHDGSLYYEENNILTHKQTSFKSPFRRIISIHPIDTQMNYSSWWLIYQITSTVYYNSNVGSGNVTLQSFVGLTR
jgi:prepilin-type N-terminal cleavage/methylation domain-containing protein